MEVLRTTNAMCPTCLRIAPGRVEKDEEGIWLARECPEHGGSRTRLSAHPEQWGNLHNFYFGLIGF